MKKGTKKRFGETSSVYWVPLVPVAVLIVFAACGVFVGARYYLSWLNPMASPEVRYVVPVGFRVAICILPTAKGTPLTQGDDGVVEIKIPASGRVTVRANGLFSGWHRESAVYLDGEQLQIGVQSSENDTSSVALWSLYTDDKDRIWKFVGTRAEMLEAIDVVHLTPGTNWKPPANGGEAIARPIDD